MTHIHQDESPRERSRKRKRDLKASVAPFDPKEVVQGKKLVATLKAENATLKTTQAAIESTEMKLGKLSDPVETKYGDGALAKFAKIIGIKLDRLNRCRSVYRAYKDKDIKAPAPNFAVLRELQGHPNREQIIREHPDLTKREARTFMKDYREAQGQKEDWQVGETRRWFNQAKKHAQEAIQYGHPKQERLDPKIMGLAIDDWDTLEGSLDKGSRALATLRDEVKRVRPLALPKPPLALPRPMFDDPKPSEAPQNEGTQTDTTPDEDSQTDASNEDNATPSD